jgi:hypothetical protein
VTLERPSTCYFVGAGPSQGCSRQYKHPPSAASIHQGGRPAPRADFFQDIEVSRIACLDLNEDNAHVMCLWCEMGLGGRYLSVVEEGGRARSKTLVPCMDVTDEAREMSYRTDHLTPINLEISQCHWD